MKVFSLESFSLYVCYAGNHLATALQLDNQIKSCLRRLVHLNFVHSFACPRHFNKYIQVFVCITQNPKTMMTIYNIVVYWVTFRGIAQTTYHRCVSVLWFGTGAAGAAVLSEEAGGEDPVGLRREEQAGGRADDAAV